MVEKIDIILALIDFINDTYKCLDLSSENIEEIEFNNHIINGINNTLQRLNELNVIVHKVNETYYLYKMN
jgi:hypothetical protein